MPLAVRVLLVVATVLLSGCSSFSFTPKPCPQPDAWFLAGPLDAQGRLPVDEPGREPTYQRILYWMGNPTAANATIDFTLFSHGLRNGQWYTDHINDTGPRASIAPHGTKLGGATPLFNRT